MGGVWRGLGFVTPCGEVGLELRDYVGKVAVHSEGRIRSVSTELIRGDVDLDEFSGCVPFRRGTEMENPIETGTKEKDNVGFAKSGTAGAGGVEGVGVWKDAFAHRRWKKRNLSVGNEGIDGI